MCDAYISYLGIREDRMRARAGSNLSSTGGLEIPPVGGDKNTSDPTSTSSCSSSPHKEVVVCGGIESSIESIEEGHGQDTTTTVEVEASIHTDSDRDITDEEIV
jgi:hypothetical protein